MVCTPKHVDSALLRLARKARITEQIAHLDYMRALLEAANTMNQTQVAQGLGISQPAVSQSCKVARALERVPAGRICATAEEAVKRYLIGEFSATQAASEITSCTSDVAGALQRTIDTTHCVIADLKRLIARLEEMGYALGGLRPAVESYAAKQG